MAKTANCILFATYSHFVSPINPDAILVLLIICLPLPGHIGVPERRDGAAKWPAR